MTKNNPFYSFKSMSFIYISCFLLLFFNSCSTGDSDLKTGVSNLQVEVSLAGASEQQPNGDGSGVVQVTATANNAVRYAFRFDSGDVQESTSGTMEYIFSEEGTHTTNVVVWAYSESGEFINETVDFTVFKSDAQFTKLVFSDEFESEGSLEEEKWHHQVIPPNNGSWHNGELQHYTARTENSFVSDGTLKIKAIKEQYTYGASTKSYTSARLNSKFAFTFGRVEVRAKLPEAAGTWPAIWTLGANCNETGSYFEGQYGSGQWPGCGEIDIMEQTGWNKNEIISHFHWGDRNTGEYKNIGGTLPVANTAGEFHVYSMEWTDSSIKTFVDGELVYELPNSSEKPYDHPHYLLLNIALGGNLGGEVPENFTEAIFEIDYVKVFQ
ncbi:glycoside hydrolase family 16 protein [Zunongwangia sp. F260]|uniref:Glycoside hydrolase family 16 protein n=1 Tax=Autumnicola lenta TaxID=3075593 RepID=A0ABU3CLM6_9FLAO|nr:glycoside hydrolase family 16 protein [Zunongwangia sp. F260]MDT0647157.1 glycoside hydrolase family 16 protein [Zunongwangia sp. F260]